MRTYKIVALCAVFIAALCVFSGCDEAESDTWTPVTDKSQLQGSWKGNRQKVSVKDKNTGESYDATLSGSLVYSGGTITSSTTKDITEIINAYNKEQAGAGDLFWGLMSMMAGTDLDPATGEKTVITVTQNPPPYEMTIVSTMPDTAVTAEQLAKIEINEKGDKIRYPYEGSAFVMEKQ